MRIFSTLLVTGLALGTTCAVASSASAGDFDASTADLGRPVVTVPSAVSVSPQSILCGGAYGLEAPEPDDALCRPTCPKWSVTVGLWIFGVSGTVGDDGRSVEVDSDWTDTLSLLDKIEFAADVRARYKTGAWSFNLEVDGAKMADSATFLDGAVEVEGEMSLWIVQAHVGYNIAGGKLGCNPCAPVGCLEVYAGVRGWWLDVDVDGVGIVAPGPRIDSSNNWIDPIVGLRGDLHFNDRWFAVAEFDIGGFGVGSDFSWNAMAAVGFAISHVVSVEVGWKHLDVDYQDGTFIFDVALSGPFLAFTFTF